MQFSVECRCCPRLAGFLDQVRTAHPDYHALPVSSFGEAGNRFLIVGLAPGMHGANRTGRPFTGNYAGNLLYGALHEYGFAFAHGARHALPGGLTLYDSYHCSRYNPQTRRLTGAMFRAVIGSIAKHLER